MNGTRGHELAGQRIVVTGSSSGIGRAIAIELATAGARVLVHAARSLAAAEEVASLVEAAAPDGVVAPGVVMADLRDPAACRSLVRDGFRALGGVDIWINNAGADVLTGAAAHLGFADKLALLWEVDVRATMTLTREAGRRMRETGGGAVINMGWNQAETGMEGDSGELFAATKGAIMAFTRSAAVTLAPSVRVNCLAPGWIRTAWGEQANDDWQRRATSEAPLGRWGTPEDVARVARFLASPAAEFLTGQIVRVDGGAVR